MAVATFLLLYQRFFQLPYPRSPTLTLEYLTELKWKVLGLFGNIGSECPYWELQWGWIVIKPLADTPSVLLSQRLFLTSTGSPFWSFSNSCPQRLRSCSGFGGEMFWTHPTWKEQCCSSLISGYITASGSWFGLKKRI